MKLPNLSGVFAVLLCLAVASPVFAGPQYANDETRRVIEEQQEQHACLLNTTVLRGSRSS